MNIPVAWLSLGSSFRLFASTSLILFTKFASAETIFFEAESMQPTSNGWVITSNDQTRRASRTKTLWGADGPGNSVAIKTVNIRRAGRFRIWVRSLQVAAWRGPFQLTVSTGDKDIKQKVFDSQAVAGVPDWEYTWQSLDAELPAGDVTLTLSKHEQKNCVGYVRHVDFLLLTSDESLVPDHLSYGPQTFVRVTMGEGYDRPVYLHLFADHYRSPWYAHYAIGKDGIRAALAPPNEQLMTSGDVTPWCNLTSTVYQDSGAALNFSVRHSYHEKATQFKATLEFGRNRSDDMNDVEVVKKFDVEATPNGLVIITPPHLESRQNVQRLKRDRDFADEIGKLADSFQWPTHGRKPVKIPFLVSASISGYEMPVDNDVQLREQKTLDYFGFNGAYERIQHGAWQMKNDSYCQPDIDEMKKRARHQVELFKKSGRSMDEIAARMLMDEPTGQPAAFAVKDLAYRARFREWLKGKSLTLDDLLVASWEDVRPVAEAERTDFPALHYFTQLFRTRALGDFMATQRRIIDEAYGVDTSKAGWASRPVVPSSKRSRGTILPTCVNFSDGAVYYGNFCGQGVDYFELLDADDQNAIWGEDWANNSSTFQCGAFNVALMQAAAKRRGQTIGHYLIAHAGRTPWDIKTKAVSETARGVRIWMNFAYGPNWSSHEGGPAWRSHLWHSKPELWTANAEITREIGAVEDWLVTAEHSPSKVAILYSSSSDIWTMQSNLAFGFDRMHTWLALTHSQTPVDIVPEREFDRLDQYKVCYLSGPNLTLEAATKLRRWVAAGGTLWLTAGAASRDEFDRPNDLLTGLPEVERGELTSLEPYHNSGKFLSYLKVQDTVRWGKENLEVLSVKQTLKSHRKNHSNVLATFANGEAAVIDTHIGNGRVVVLGFLPALSYIKPALTARQPLEKSANSERLAAEKLAEESAASADADQPVATSATVSGEFRSSRMSASADDEFLNRSHNPWQFPAGIREQILFPVRTAKLASSLTCDTPLIDAVELRCDQGVLIALSNHTLHSLDRVGFDLRTDKPIMSVESVRHGQVAFEQLPDGGVRFGIPLDASDFVMVSTKPMTRDRSAR